MSWSRPFGAVLIVAGTAIGGGMLALPIVSAKLGFLPMLFILFSCWFVMCWSSLLTLKVNLIIEPGSTFLVMSDKALGVTGKILSTLSFLLLFYAVLAAYISGSASFLENFFSQQLFSLSHTGYCIAATGAMVVILLMGVKIVDRINRLFFCMMIACFIMILFFLLGAAKISAEFTLINYNYNTATALAILPVVYTAFGFHGCTTPLISYVGNNPPVLRRVFIIGSTIPLIVYILWLTASFGVLTGSQINELATHGTIGELINTLTAVSRKAHWFNKSLNLFSGCAIITSFLGVALGLFDYIYFGLQKKICDDSTQDNATRFDLITRVLAGILTFAPPLFFAIYYPDGFILALGYAAIPLAFIAIFLPLAMLWVLHRQGHIFKGKMLYLLCALFTVVVVIAQLGVAWHFLPSVNT
ncbi:MAG: hypothetical protein OXC48_01745 [Endozoicomonadaceae bacterium]|nr:hypothetical protein [Endozoicomonadaceae bacterium]